MTYTYKEIWKISYPILAGLVIQQLIGLTDTAFLGRVGDIELGASAIAGVYYIMIFMLGQGFSIGAQIIIARRNGEKNYAQTAPIVYAGIAFLEAAALIFILLSLNFSPYILGAVISSPEIYQAAVDYLDYRIFGFFFAFIIIMFRAFYVGIINTKVLSANALIMLFVNIGLDYLFIFGNFGFPAMGIKGAALASVIAEAVSALFFIVYTICRIDIRKYGFMTMKIFDFGLLKNILNVSVWTMLQAFISIATWFLFFVAIEHLGEKALAISNILRGLSSLPYMIAMALGAAANSITSNLIGENKSYEVMKASKKAIVMAYGFGLACELLMLIFPIQSMKIYTDNATLIQDALPAFYAMLTIYLTIVPGTVLFNVVSGTGDTKKAMYMELISITFYMANVWYVVVYLRADLMWCWTCEHSYNIVLFWLAYRHLKRVCFQSPARHSGDDKLCSRAV